MEPVEEEARGPQNQDRKHDEDYDRPGTFRRRIDFPSSVHGSPPEKQTFGLFARSKRGLLFVSLN
jgi:hypothetical protein